MFLRIVDISPCLGIVHLFYYHSTRCVKTNTRIRCNFQSLEPVETLPFSIIRSEYLSMEHPVGNFPLVFVDTLVLQLVGQYDMIATAVYLSAIRTHISPRQRNICQSIHQVTQRIPAVLIQALFALETHYSSIQSVSILDRTSSPFPVCHVTTSQDLTLQRSYITISIFIELYALTYLFSYFHLFVCNKPKVRKKGIC